MLSRSGASVELQEDCSWEQDSTRCLLAGEITRRQASIYPNSRIVRLFFFWMWTGEASQCRLRQRNHGRLEATHEADSVCKRGEIVQGDEGLVGGVAQVVCHGVIVVVGHQEEGQEEKGEKQGEVEGEVEKLKDNRTSWMARRWGERQVRTALSHMECDEWSNEEH